MDPLSDLFQNIEEWNYKQVTISHPEARDYYAVDWLERQRIDDRLTFWGFSGERTVWCSSTDREVVKIDLKELREEQRIETALPLQSEVSCLQNFTAANESYLAAVHAGSSKVSIQYYDIKKGEGFEVLLLAEKAGWVNQCWLRNHWLMTTVNLQDESVFSPHLAAIDLKNRESISKKLNSERIDDIALLPEERLAVSSCEGIRLIDLSTGSVLKQVDRKFTYVFGSAYDSFLAIDRMNRRVQWLDPKSLREIGQSQQLTRIRKVEQLTETDLFLVVGEDELLNDFKIKFKAVRLKSDSHYAEELMMSKTFTVPNPKHLFCDMKWGRFAYMNPGSLQLVIMDFAAGAADPVDIII